MRPTGYLYKCNDCGKEYSTFGIMYLCPWCSPGNSRTAPPKGVLGIHYDYPEIRKSITGFTDLKNNGFISLLPIDRVGSLPPLRVGNTPLYPVQAGVQSHLGKIQYTVRQGGSFPPGRGDVSSVKGS